LTSRSCCFFVDFLLGDVDHHRRSCSEMSTTTDDPTRSVVVGLSPSSVCFDFLPHFAFFRDQTSALPVAANDSLACFHNPRTVLLLQSKSLDNSVITPRLRPPFVDCSRRQQYISSLCSWVKSFCLRLLVTMAALLCVRANRKGGAYMEELIFISMHMNILSKRCYVHLNNNVTVLNTLSCRKCTKIYTES
jgi:hypothetical protein